MFQSFDERKKYHQKHLCFISFETKNHEKHVNIQRTLTDFHFIPTRRKKNSFHCTKILGPEFLLLFILLLQEYIIYFAQ